MPSYRRLTRASQVLSRLHSFGADGISPVAGLTLDSQGNLYGTTVGGGAGNGVVFELKPGSSGYTASVLYSFVGSSNGTNDGSSPFAGVIIDSQGNLYGTNSYGGGPADDGTVFELKPNGSGGYTETVLYSFTGSKGPGPNAGLTFDSQGNLYGTCVSDGYGFVFEIQ